MTDEDRSIDLYVEENGGPAECLTAIQRAAQNHKLNSAEQQILRILREFVSEYPPLHYVRMKCSISIEQTGEDSSIASG
jgi:hypothetical protein